MDSDQATPIQKFLQDLGIPFFEARGEQVLVLGLKRTFKHVDTPDGERDRFDRPSRGLVLVVGPGKWISEKIVVRRADNGQPAEEYGERCYNTTQDLKPGMICFFGKFESSELEIGRQKLYLVDQSRIGGILGESTERLVAELLKQSY